MKRMISFVSIWLSLVLNVAGANVVWFDGTNPITYSVPQKVNPVVTTALEMWKDDMRQVTGFAPVAAQKPTIVISQGQGSDDGFRISVKDGQILIEGHNARGTAYGILELSRLAGVSPWIWWGDLVPEKKDRLALSDDFSMEHTPSVTYRGIFINDEDWSTRPWSCRNFAPGPEGQIAAQTYKKIFQLLLRLRANTVWPAMHEGTVAFFQTPGAKAMADSCGIVVGTSHCEPLLRNNVGEWNSKERGRFNYKTNRDAVQQYWIERLKEVKGSQNHIFTIGMRGIHDSSMEGYQTDQEKFDGLQLVINDQQELLRQYLGDPSRLPQMFVPYKEVLQLYEMGLQVPDYVTLMWCDDNYGYMTRFSDAREQQRQGGGGVYYHLSYWGRPHDYLWLTTTQPGLIYNEMREAYDHHVRKLWIANVHDVKVAGYDLELFLDMAWDIKSVSASSLNDHYRRWLSPVDSIGMTVREAAARLADFERIKASVADCRSYVRPELSDAFFAAVEYPVYAAAAMSRKILSDSAESHRAYEEIQSLTTRYNSLQNGKWNGLMDAAPRQLPVFADVRGSHFASEAADVIAIRSAADYQQASAGAEPVQMLGHSMQAVRLPKGDTLTWCFSVEREGDYTLTTALIPTHAVDAGDIRYSVTVDDMPAVVWSLKEPFRSEEWKRNVLRNQALRHQTIHLSSGSHQLTIKALDDHIVVDQWKLTAVKAK